MPVRRLNHAVLYVRDLPRTVSFYCETLGFEIRTEIRDRAAFLRAPGSVNDHDLGLFAIGDAELSGPEPRVGLYHLAWEVGSLADLRRARCSGRRRARRPERPPRLQVPVRQDPNGIEFEVMWRVPAEDWDEELSEGSMIAPLDLDAALARWGDRITGAAAGSST